jgi:MFS superfamily sulfate permease-like transporter
VVASVGFFVTSVSKVKLAVSREGNEERIAVTGNLFYASLDRLAEHLRADPRVRTVLDLSRVSYLDGAAVDLIQKIRAERARNGGRLEVAPALDSR